MQMQINQTTIPVIGVGVTRASDGERAESIRKRRYRKWRIVHRQRHTLIVVVVIVNIFRSQNRLLSFRTCATAAPTNAP